MNSETRMWTGMVRLVRFLTGLTWRTLIWMILAGGIWAISHCWAAISFVEALKLAASLLAGAAVILGAMADAA